MAEYTETFQTFIQNSYHEGVPTPSWLEIIQALDKFPNFEFGELTNYVNLSMYGLITKTYRDREIAFEDEEEFAHHFMILTNKLLIEYLPKIKMWIDNFNSLFDFKVKLKFEDKQQYSNGNQNTYYLNPVTAQTGVYKTTIVNPTTGETTTHFTGGNLKVQDIDTTDNTGERSRVIEREALQAVWGKTRPVILQQIFELKSIYLECLDRYEEMFMGVY